MTGHPTPSVHSWSGVVPGCERSASARLAAGLRRWLTGWAALALSGCMASDQPSAPANAIRIGAVLPFSGARAASGVPLEAALRLAITEVNAAGGLAGRSLWLDIADSHSDDARGTANALGLIEDNALPFFVGTEEPKIAYQLTSAVKAHAMVHLMPALTSSRFHDPSAAAAWFRLSPSVTYIACSLGKRVLEDGHTDPMVVVDADDYSRVFAVKFGSVFRIKGYSTSPTLIVEPHQSSYTGTFETILHLAPDALVLMTSPAVAVGFLQEWVARGRPVKIYLGPTLRDPELLRNVPMGILEGVNGVSPDLGDEAPRFASFFEAHTTVLPVAGSHYYYDAAALLALAVAEGFAQEGSIPTPAAIKPHMLSVTSPTGTVVSFDQLALGFALLAARQKISYRGAAGAYVLSTLGDSTLNRGAIWEIAGTEFVTIGHEQCDRTDVDDEDDLL